MLSARWVEVTVVEVTVLQVSSLRDASGRYYLDDRWGDPTLDGDPRWLGRLSSEFNLAGPVDTIRFSRMLGGASPNSGRALGAHHQVAALDLTFTAPKSVSVVFALGDATQRQVILDAHRRATATAVSVLEDWSGVRRAVGGARSEIPAAGLAAAEFVHVTNRAHEPHLHSHVVAANLTQGSDGRWSALDARSLHQRARGVGALYDAQMRADIGAHLGWGWRHRANGAVELDGVTPELIGLFSSRAAEIRELRFRGLPAPAAQRRTREAKDIGPSSEMLRDDWQHRIDQWGVQLQPIARKPERSRLDERRFAQGLAASPGPLVAMHQVAEHWARAATSGVEVAEALAAIEQWCPPEQPGRVARTPRADLVVRPDTAAKLGGRPAGVVGQRQWQAAARQLDRCHLRWSQRAVIREPRRLIEEASAKRLTDAYRQSVGEYLRSANERTR